MGIMWTDYVIIVNYEAFVGIAVVMLISVMSFSLNSLIDAKDTDRSNRSSRFGYTNPVLIKPSLSSMLKVLNFTSVPVAILLSTLVSVFFLTLVSLSITLSVFYSYWPRFKARAPWDLISNILGFFVIPFCGGWSIRMPVCGIPLHYILGLSLISAPMYIMVSALDYTADKGAELKTTVVVLGVNKGMKMGALCFMLGVAIVWRDVVYAPLAIYTLPLVAASIMYCMVKPEGVRKGLIVCAFVTSVYILLLFTLSFLTITPFR
jgi:4-hydroxybenzoate polyprenyltransferase